MSIELVRDLRAYECIFNPHYSNEHLLFNSIRQIELTFTPGLRNACLRFNVN